ncbi:DsrE family protein [bacterium]|nr:DsrE family protein [bacterium]
MSSKILVIISTGDPSKAQTGMMYTVNALKNAWMEDVKLFFFGPAEATLLQDERLQHLLEEYQNEGESVVACKIIADRDGHAKDISALGVQVQYVGQQISSLIQDGYVPMVW